MSQFQNRLLYISRQETGVEGLPKWPSVLKAQENQFLGGRHSLFNDGGRPSSGSAFVSGFVLGGLVVGALGCVYAPQISKALAGTDKKELLNKLPKFIYDEDKILEKQRKKLAEKIEQLNADIDNVSTQFNSKEKPLTGAAVNADDIEAVV